MMPGFSPEDQQLSLQENVKQATGGQQLSPNLSNHIEDPPPPKRTAAPVASRRGGKETHFSQAQTYNALSLPDKAALAAEITADKRLRRSDKVVACALLFRFHNTKTGQCNPSYEILAEICSLTRRAVIDSIHRLEAAGWLTVERTSGGRNRRNHFRFLRRQDEPVISATPIKTPTVKGEDENNELAFTADGEPAFTRIEPGNLNTGKEHQHLSRSNESFDRFWSAYPRKVSKKVAERLFERILERGEATADELIAGAERYAEQCREHGTEPRFIKHPTTWLNAGCWDDEPASPEALNGQRGTNQPKQVLRGRGAPRLPGASMTHLTPTEPTPSRAVITTEKIESLAREAQSIAEARSIIASLAREEPCTLEDADGRISMLAALSFDERMLEAVSARIAEGRRPASLGEIGKCLVFLDKAFYNSRDKGEVSGALMFDEVVIASPGTLVLESAVRKLWRTLDWFPSIAQLLQAIREEEARWQYWLRCVSEVHNEHAQALTKLEKARAWLARTDEERAAERQKRLDALRRLKQQINAEAADRP